MRYRTVLFDVGGTLIGPRQSFGEIYARVLVRYGVSHPPAAFEAALRAEWDEMNRAIPPGADRYSHFPDGESGFWLRVVRGTIARVTGRPVPDGLPGSVLDALRDEFRHRDAWEVFDDVVPTLEALRGQGVRLGIVSNWDSRLPAVLERLELAPYFDAVTVSSIAGVEKPDPRIFHRALRELGATALSTLHVGDLPETDLEGARAAGLLGVLVDRAGRLDPSLGALPDLRSLPALARDGALPVPDSR
jgi:putative hydrolase of the HAD superfamily